MLLLAVLRKCWSACPCYIFVAFLLRVCECVCTGVFLLHYSRPRRRQQSSCDVRTARSQTPGRRLSPNSKELYGGVRLTSKMRETG